MTEFYGFSDRNSLDRVIAATRRSEREVGTNRVPRGEGAIFDDCDWEGVFNNEAAADCPTFGILLASGMYSIPENAQPPVGQVKRPDTYGCQFNAYVAIQGGIAHQKTGGAWECIAGHSYYVAYDNADGAPAYGDSWGPRSGTFLAKKNTGGFRVLGVVDSTNHWMLARYEPMVTFYGKNISGSTISKGSTGTIRVYSGSTVGSPTDTSQDMANCLAEMGNVANNSFIRATYLYDAPWTSGKANWAIVQTDTCPP